ncbi:MAG: 4Fe-4S binding protein [Campylobacterales bacterium]|nr:4Fe-4S binding protein [Campylobacterales bacterium]
MDKFLTLTSLRRVVQLFSFIVFVYGAYLFNTFYSTDKLTQALPALSCAYDRQGGDYCALIPLQHQMDHRVANIFNGADILSSLMPTLITLGTFFILILLFNKAFCGWSCPLGFFQEVLNIVAQKLKIKQIETLNINTIKATRVTKWLIFLFLIFIFPILTGVGILGHEFGSAYCSICPSRILTTLFVGDFSQIYIDSASTWYFILSLIADLLFGLMIALALFIKQPFCRICPMLPLQSVFKKLSFLKLTKNGSSKCDSCKMCVKACPMDIVEIQQQAVNKNITFNDCTLCGRCVEFCPHDDVLSIKYGKFSIFKSNKEYFKKRIKIEKES